MLIKDLRRERPKTFEEKEKRREENSKAVKSLSGEMLDLCVFLRCEVRGKEGARWWLPLPCAQLERSENPRQRLARLSQLSEVKLPLQIADEFSKDLGCS